MNIVEYCYLITKTLFPFAFIGMVIIVEYAVLRFKHKNFSLSHVFSNFGVLFLGVFLFWLFDHFIVSRESVLFLASKYTYVHTGISWSMFFAWIIIFDCINYLTHLLYHKSDFFWMFHAVHHSDTEVDASTTIRVPITASFFTVSAYVLLTFLGVNLILQPALAQTIFLQQVLVHSFLLRGVFPKWVSYIFITPDMHAIHHTKKYSNKNYGFLFSWWDILFKTEYLKKYNREEFGITSYQKTKNPIRIQVEPILKYIKK